MTTRKNANEREKKNTHKRIKYRRKLKLIQCHTFTGQSAPPHRHAFRKQRAAKEKAPNREALNVSFVRPLIISSRPCTVHLHHHFWSCLRIVLVFFCLFLELKHQPPLAAGCCLILFCQFNLIKSSGAALCSPAGEV